MPDETYGIDDLRYAVNLFNQCNETFLQRWPADDLLKIAIAHRASGWDIYPDQWTARQLREATTLRRPPQWSPDEEPIYTPRKVKP